MRRVLPLLIVVLGLAALAVDVLPVPRLWAGTGTTAETKLGLDLVGGLQGEYQAVAPAGQTPSTGDMATIRTIIENRVNANNVSEPVVETLGADRIVVSLPGVTDQEQIRALIGSTGRLDFVPLPADQYGTSTAPGTAPVPSQGSEIDPGLQPLFSGDQIDPGGVGPGLDSSGARAVNFKLKGDGAKAFATYTTAHVGGYFAIVLDGIVQSAPVIQSAIPGGTGQITGNFTAAQVTQLVTVLRFGALPLQLHELQFSTISATLGQDFLARTLIAGLMGILLVFLFMLIYYRLPGVVACIALLYYALVVFAVFRLIPVTLTLAGIAGFVLSVGMAVDANILIFERTKEELRAGKTVTAAVEAGFNRAWNSILDSNVSSLITATILYVWGSSTIKGFALVLIIGVLTSMLTAISLSRTILRWAVRQPWARHARYYAVHEDEFLTTTPRTRSREAGARV